MKAERGGGGGGGGGGGEGVDLAMDFKNKFLGWSLQLFFFAPHNNIIKVVVIWL